MRINLGVLSRGLTNPALNLVLMTALRALVAADAAFQAHNDQLIEQCSQTDDARRAAAVFVDRGTSEIVEQAVDRAAPSQTIAIVFAGFARFVGALSW